MLCPAELRGRPASYPVLGSVRTPCGTGARRLAYPGDVVARHGEPGSSGRRSPGGFIGAIDWPAVVAELSARPRTQLSPAELDDLADGLFWCDRLPESLDARRDAYRAHVAADDHAAAAATTWRLFYEHFLVGESALANGWLERCRGHCAHADSPAVRGWLSIADGDVASRDGDTGRAIELGVDACALGRRLSDPDLTAMALQLEGRARIDVGDRRTGLSRLDEAMVAVINDELAPLFTGWIYCNVVSTCYELADLERATEWSEAALRWCATIRDGRLYRGLCRVYAVELASLRGDWSNAVEDADRACDELTTHDRRYAGAAHYLAGELRRRVGDRDGAAARFASANELGFTPQPGHALLVADAGRPQEAVEALRSSLLPGPNAPLPRAQLLAALIEVADRAGDERTIISAGAELEALAAAHATVTIDAIALAAAGRSALARRDLPAAIGLLRRAVELLADIGLPYESALARCHLANAASEAGDRQTCELELTAAARTFAHLDAEPDRVRAAARLDDLRSRAGSDRSSPRGPLSTREVEVLSLVAEGRTNREIATALVVSPHTVARHVSNILTKLGVSSRAAATKLALERGLL
jgi:DNA-binding NarL/FixJ family response regulator